MLDQEAAYPDQVDLRNPGSRVILRG